VGAQIVETVTHVSDRRHRRLRRLLRGTRDWVRSRYGLREIIFPEKYFVDQTHDVVVTYSSCLALVYFAQRPQQLELDGITSDRQSAALYDALLQHPGIGLVATRTKGAVHLRSREGAAIIEDGSLRVIDGENPLEPYGTAPYIVRAVRDLVSQPNAGDLVLFGAYDGYEIVSFDDQIGAHGSAGGDQVWPFIITPPDLDLSRAILEDARDIHSAVMCRYADCEGEEEPAVEVDSSGSVRA
jgi:hypothetical protein